MRRAAKILIALFAMLVVTLTACEGPTHFKVIGEIAGAPNTNLYVKYYGNNAVQTGITPAREGKFEAVFSSVDPALVEILDNERNMLALLYLKNGDEVNVQIDRDNPYKNTVTGNEINTQLAEAINTCSEALISGDKARINEAVEQYVSSHPQSVVSTIMFVRFYDSSTDPLRADSVLTLISPDARPAGLIEAYSTQITPFIDEAAYQQVPVIRYRTVESDSAIEYNASSHPLSLIVISNENSRRGDSIVPHLKEIHKKWAASKLKIMDIGVFSDTNSWKHVVKRDSAKWTQGWLPGGILGKGLRDLAIPAVPYFIVTDSAGHQLYRGSSIEAAKEVLNKKSR